MMMKSFESIRYVCEHGEMDFVVDVFPINIKTKISFSAPVPRYSVVCLQDHEEVVGVNFANVFDAKVVNAE